MLQHVLLHSKRDYHHRHSWRDAECVFRDIPWDAQRYQRDEKGRRWTEEPLWTPAEDAWLHFLVHHDQRYYCKTKASSHFGKAVISSIIQCYAAIFCLFRIYQQKQTVFLCRKVRGKIKEEIFAKKLYLKWKIFRKSEKRLNKQR